MGARDELTPAAAPEASARLLRRRLEQGPLWMPVDGTSMGRTIRAGSEVLLVPADAPRTGEVWAFYSDAGVLVMHRCLGRAASGLRFQGDAHFEDPPVRDEALVGRAVRVRRDGREYPLGERDRLVRGTWRLLQNRARALARRLGARRVKRLLRRGTPPGA